jgi:hypothetical protein
MSTTRSLGRPTGRATSCPSSSTASGSRPWNPASRGATPWSLLGGEIERVITDVSGDAFVDLAREAQTTFACEQM